MLGEFQQALVDLTGSPALCVAVRDDLSILQRRYRLTDREHRRLTGIVRHPGMAGACTVYRANRLAPLVLNVPETCRALGSDLRAVVSEYWASFPETNVHFYIEAERFCLFLQNRLAHGLSLTADVSSVLARERAIVAAAIDESHTEGRGAAAGDEVAVRVSSRPGRSARRSRRG